MFYCSYPRLLLRSEVNITVVGNMDRQELQEKYEAGDLNDIHSLKAHRTEIREHTGLFVPLRPAKIRSWWAKKKSVFSRRISSDEEDWDEDVEDEEGGEQDSEQKDEQDEDGTEGGDS